MWLSILYIHNVDISTERKCDEVILYVFLVRFWVSFFYKFYVYFSLDYFEFVFINIAMEKTHVLNNPYYICGEMSN